MKAEDGKIFSKYLCGRPEEDHKKPQDVTCTRIQALDAKGYSTGSYILNLCYASLEL
jgi:hypothetical protein